MDINSLTIGELKEAAKLAGRLGVCAEPKQAAPQQENDSRSWQTNRTGSMLGSSKATIRSEASQKSETAATWRDGTERQAGLPRSRLTVFAESRPEIAVLALQRVTC